ncbi:MAG: zinc ribbon domain-containing protein [Candidatus Thermoplasmatota archaeon]|nr:zinc ribbon domain-containing protein [Candidatus Thermoplasmatota archaeon]MCL5794291.1 zinc ribbon domain-containing protein [Candidatus Thermoplasmatota archaeon]
MPIYEPTEKEIMHEYVTFISGREDISGGNLFLTDRRLIYERKGHRGMFSATSAAVSEEIQLHEVSNVTTAVPRFKMFTKKTFSVEFESNGSKQVVRFQVKDPAQWKENITKWAIDAKRVHEEERHRTTEEDYRKKLEMARAKAGTTNVGVLHVNSPNEVRKKAQPQKNHRADVIDAEDLGTTAMQKTENMPPAEVKYCPECGYTLDSSMKYCPSCGTKVS